MPRISRGRLVYLAIVALLAAAVMLSRMVEPSSPLAGHATAVDGDTLRLGGSRIRILGIDAPELSQDCTDRSGIDWPCGEVAREAMISLLKGGDVICQPRGRDRYHRVLARCSVGDAEIGQIMVREGLAVADGDYSGDEAQARAGTAGIWSGTFIRPAEWRRTHGEGGAESQDGLLGTIRSWLR